MSQTIDHERSVVEFKLQSLKALETWVTMCADDPKSNIVRDLEAAQKHYTLPGTTRMFYRLMDDDEKFYAVHVLTDMNALWNHFAQSPQEEFGDAVPHFRNYCVFLFHTKSYYILTASMLYMILVEILCICLGPSGYALYLQELVFFVLMWAVYLSLFRIYRGNLLTTDYLHGFVRSTRLQQQATGYESSREEGRSVSTSSSLSNRRLQSSNDRSGTVSTESSAAFSVDQPATLHEEKSFDPSVLSLLYKVLKEIFKFLFKIPYYTVTDQCGLFWFKFRTFLFSNGFKWGGAPVMPKRRTPKEPTPSELHSTGSFFTSNHFQKIQRKMGQKNTIPTLGFYQQLNVCYKFISLFRSKEMSILPPGSIQRGLAAFVIFSFFTNAMHSVFARSSIKDNCRQQRMGESDDDLYNESYCRTYLVHAVLSLNYLLPGFITFVLQVSLGVSIAGIGYGAYVASKSVEMWKSRYRHLRRVAFRDLTGEDLIDNSAGSSIVLDDVSKYFDKIIEEYEEIMEDQRVERNIGVPIESDEAEGAAGSGSGGQKRRIRRSIRGSILMPAVVPQSSAEKGSDSRNSSPCPASDKSTSDDVVHRIGLSIHITDLLKTLPLLQKDAEESYIFRQEYMNQLTYTWSLFIFLLVLVSFGILTMTLVFVNFSSGQAFTIAISVFLCGLLYILPLSSMAYANESVKSLEEVVKKSGMDDFRVIGGREHWLSHIKNAKTYWCLMSFPITYDVIVGSLVTCLTGALYVYAQKIFYSTLQ